MTNSPSSNNKSDNKSDTKSAAKDGAQNNRQTTKNTPHGNTSHNDGSQNNRQTTKNASHGNTPHSGNTSHSNTSHSGTTSHGNTPHGNTPHSGAQNNRQTTKNAPHGKTSHSGNTPHSGNTSHGNTPHGKTSHSGNTSHGNALHGNTPHSGNTSHGKTSHSGNTSHGNALHGNTPHSGNTSHGNTPHGKTSHSGNTPHSGNTSHSNTSHSGTTSHGNTPHGNTPHSGAQNNRQTTKNAPHGKTSHSGNTPHSGTTSHGNTSRGGSSYGNTSRGGSAYGTTSRGGNAYGNTSRGGNAPHGNTSRGGNAPHGNTSRGGSSYGNTSRGGSAYGNTSRGGNTPHSGNAPHGNTPHGKTSHSGNTPHSGNTSHGNTSRGGGAYGNTPHSGNASHGNTSRGGNAPHGNTSRGGNAPHGNTSRGGSSYGNTSRGGNSYGNTSRGGGASRDGNTSRGGSSYGNTSRGGGASRDGNTSRGGSSYGNTSRGGGASRDGNTSRGGSSYGNTSRGGGASRDGNTSRGGNTSHGTTSRGGGASRDGNTSRGGSSRGGTSRSGSSSYSKAKNRVKSHIIKKNNRSSQSYSNKPTSSSAIRRRSDATIRDSDSVRLKSEYPDRFNATVEQEWNDKPRPLEGVRRGDRGRPRFGSRNYFQSQSEPGTEKAAHPRKETIKASPIPKSINIMDVVTISDMAKKMNLKAPDLISKLLSLGMMVGINDQIDSETATLVAAEYGCEVHIVSIYDETAINIDTGAHAAEPRPPVVTVMGHVDHGKTKLLDYIRSANVVDQEHGGITQHIAAYQIVHNDSAITFIDTPGHEAFTLMRARGAQITDIVVLVVAADDGVMPQTKEAIDHAREAKVPIVVAINKIDLPETNIDKIYQQLSDSGLVPEEWGGETVCCQISALKGTGVHDLVDALLVVAEEHTLQSPRSCRAEGRILESRVDHGRGILCTVLVQSGTLRNGDSFLAGVYPGRVRAMLDDRGNKISEALPSTPVEVVGFSEIPEAGDPFQVAESEKEARNVSAKRQELQKIKVIRATKKVGVEDIYQTIDEQSMKEFKVIVKGDVNGSVEAIKTALERIENDTIRLQVIRAAAGNINENDVMLASASRALIVAFNVKPSAHMQKLANQEKVSIRRYSIIYAIVEEIEKILTGMLEPTYEEKRIGGAEVRTLFSISNAGTVAGSYVVDGIVRRGATVVVKREESELFKGTVATLKRFKNDAREVESGYECGIMVKGFNALQIGDILEVYETVETKKE